MELKPKTIYYEKQLLYQKTKKGLGCPNDAVLWLVCQYGDGAK